MTVGEELSTLRNLLKEVTDDSKYSNSLLFGILSRARGLVASATPKMPRWNYHRFCIELEVGKDHDCGCIEAGCEVMRSKYPIPRPLMVDYRNFFQVMDLAGRYIGHGEQGEKFTNQYDQVKKDKPFYSIYNQHLLVWNSKRTAVMANAIWEDITQWLDIQYCTDTTPCKDVFTLDMGLSSKESRLMLEQAMLLLGFPLKRVDDLLADRNTEGR